jgi:hypothetical protein
VAKALVLPLLALLTVVVACQDAPREAPATPAPRAQLRLTEREVRQFLAVRGRALQRLEGELTTLERQGGDVTSRVEELSAAEREAAESQGVGWRRYDAVRLRVSQLLTMERRRDDRRVLIGELERTRAELVRQQGTVKDPATRQAIGTRLAGIDGRLADLHRGQEIAESDKAEMVVLDAARPELAALDRRQEVIQQRIKTVLERHAPATVATPAH